MALMMKIITPRIMRKLDKDKRN